MLFFVKMIPLAVFKEKEGLPRQGSLRSPTPFFSTSRKENVGGYYPQTPSPLRASHPIPLLQNNTPQALAVLRGVCPMG